MTSSAWSRFSRRMTSPRGWLVTVSIIGLLMPIVGGLLFRLAGLLGDPTQQSIGFGLALAMLAMVFVTGCIGGYHRNWSTTIAGVVLLFITDSASSIVLRAIVGAPPPKSFGLFIIVFPSTLLCAAAAHGLTAHARRVKGLTGTYPPGHCQRCGYDLTGNVSGRCPECGESIGSEGAGTDSRGA